MKGFIFTFILFFAVACQTSLKHNPITKPSVDIEGNVISHEMIVLGSQLEDPYSIENMTKAIESIYPTKADRVIIKPTDYYLRFRPKNDDEYRKLVEDFDLQLIDHPVDFKIVKEGDYYHDPSIPDDEFTWQYTVMGINDNIPYNIEYEILDEVYIPEHDPNTKAFSDIDWVEVERESFRLSGNEEYLLETKAGENEEYVPEGQFSIYDEDADATLGLKGVLVSCNSFVKFSRTYTDDEGHYKMDRKFTSNPRYRIVFKNRYGASLGFNLLVTPASFCTLGKGSPKGLSMDIDGNSDRVLFTRCVVNNALNDYYSMCAEEESTIKSPPVNLRLWLFQNLEVSSAVMMHHGAIIEEGIIKKFLKEYTAILKFFVPDITIGLKGANSYAEIYSRTVHELAHASHFMNVGVSYWNTLSKFIMESFVTSGLVVYGAGTEENCGYCEVGEMWAYYMQNQLFKEKYPHLNYSFGTSYWFRPQIFLFIDERGLGKDKIFCALTSDITDKKLLQKKLISLNPQFKSAINTAFSRYN